MALLTVWALLVAGCGGDDPSPNVTPEELGCREALERLVQANRRVQRIVYRDIAQGIAGTLEGHVERLRGMGRALRAMEVPPRLRRLRDLNVQHVEVIVGGFELELAGAGDSPETEDAVARVLALSSRISEVQIGLLADRGCR